MQLQQAHKIPEKGAAMTDMREMDYDPSDAQLDHRFEDITRLSRRGFLKTGLATAVTGSLAVGSSSAAIRSATRADDEDYWQSVADQFLLKDGLTYLNTGTRGPSPLNVHQAQIACIQQVNEDRLGYVNNVYTPEYKTRVRARLAEYLGCHPDELAVTNNTTEGMAIGTNGPELKAGDEIIYTNHDHSSGGQPVNLRCARTGTVPVVVDLSHPRFHPPESPQVLIDAIEAAITPRTRLISFCHVNYTDGCVMPVKEICEMARSKGILTLVDGAHPPGMMGLDLHELGCDMYAGACHKWLLAGQLTGFFYVRQDLQDRIWPSIYSGPVLGKNMYGGEDDSERGTTAQRYETHGSVNYAALVSIDAALDFHTQIGPAAIESRVRYLAGKATDALLETGGVDVFTSTQPELSAGLVSFRINHLDTKALSKQLWEEHNIYIREVRHKDIGWDANRLSLHIMASLPQVERTLALIRTIAKPA